MHQTLFSPGSVIPQSIDELTSSGFVETHLVRKYPSKRLDDQFVFRNTINPFSEIS